MNGVVEIVDARVSRVPPWRLTATLQAARALVRAGIAIDVFRRRPEASTCARAVRQLAAAVAMPLVSLSARVVGIYLRRECCRLDGACMLESECTFAAGDACPKRTRR